MKLSIHEPDGVRTQTLEQVWLGLRPYALIELAPASDGSGEPALFLSAGGGAEEQPTYLPLMAVTESAPDGNPVAEMLRQVAAADPANRAGVRAVVEQLNADWMPFVFAEGVAE